MFGSVRPRYVAAHMRLGGLPGEKEFGEARGGGTLFHNLLKVIRCANRMAAREAIDQPLMVVTDNHELRGFLRVRPGGQGAEKLACGRPAVQRAAIVYT